MSPNVDRQVVADFGAEWTHFDQSHLSDTEREAIFADYFAVFPWSSLSTTAVGFDAGCGTGRWALLVAHRVGHLHCIDPSSAIHVARRNLQGLENCTLHQVTIDEMPMADESMDFGYALGVLHHLPDPSAGLARCVGKLKRGAPFLVYLYYSFDNRPAWYRAVWRLSDAIRRVTSRLPTAVKVTLAQMIAGVVYWPLARIGRVASRAGISTQSFLLSAYQDRSFYTMRTDALDRFGTRLERRFSRIEIEAMMRGAGLQSVRFSDRAPYWCAVGIKG